MSEETSMVPAVPFDLVSNPDALRGKLASYSAARTVLMEWIRNNLKPGVDFMVIHRNSCADKYNNAMVGACPKCRAKPTLVKPGAEKIHGLLQLRPTWRRDSDTWEMLGSKAGVVCFVCELVTVGGTVAAEGRGSRDAAEDNDANKAIKMAKKSALIDAVLGCAGLSEIFTQDLDTPGPGSRDYAAPPEHSEPVQRNVPEAGVRPVPKPGGPPPAVAPQCPKCGEAMRKRKGAKGEFWGCTTYPQCKGTVDANAAQPIRPPVSSPDAATINDAMREDAEAALRVMDISPDLWPTGKEPRRFSLLARCASQAVRAGLAMEGWPFAGIDEWMIEGSTSGKTFGQATDAELEKMLAWLAVKPASQRQEAV